MKRIGTVILLMTMYLPRPIVRWAIHDPAAVPSMFDLNQEVAKPRQSVTATENVARQIEGRIRQIDGAMRLLLSLNTSNSSTALRAKCIRLFLRKNTAMSSSHYLVKNRLCVISFKVLECSNVPFILRQGEAN